MNASALILDNLMRQGSLWRGNQSFVDASRLLPSGHAGLDELLHGGWPLGALTEVLSARPLGLSLFLPALAHGNQWLALLNPPYLPYAPALAVAGIEPQRVLLVRGADRQQALWAAEQCLRSRCCAGVALWADQAKPAQVRRLQLAAEDGQCLAVLFRPLSEAAQASHAALRLRLDLDAHGMQASILKQRGGYGGEAVRLG